MSTATERLMVAKEVMGLARISRTALNNLIACGALTPVKLGNRLMRFKAGEVQSLLDHGLPQTAPRKSKPYTGRPRGRRKTVRRDVDEV
jgi:predicted DNA-binding transcriptional regulator AlpA